MKSRRALSRVWSVTAPAACVTLLMLCAFDLGRGGMLYYDWCNPFIFDPATLSSFDNPPPPPSSWAGRARVRFEEWWFAERVSRWGLLGGELLLALGAGVVLGRRAMTTDRRRGPGGAGLHLRTLLLLVALAGMVMGAAQLGRRARFFAGRELELLLRAGDERYNFNNALNYKGILPNDMSAEAKAKWLSRIRVLQGRAERYGRAAARPWLAAPPDA